MNHKPLGKIGLTLPEVIFGSSILGNLYEVIPYEMKLQIVQAIFQHVQKPVVIDTAGKYGAGLALEVLGRCLHEMSIDESNVVISNKLGWLRTPLRTPEPTFEPGAWFGLGHDAVQDISYDGVLRCWEQGLELLGGDYSTQLVSVHDPDEYLDVALTERERKSRLEDVLGAYTALNELKSKGYVQAVGIGAKNWQVIQEISNLVDLDWVMLANSYTLYTHPPDLLRFMDELHQKQIAIINAAVFNAGFLIGGDLFNYRKVDPDQFDDRKKVEWRNRFFALCEAHQVTPVDACIQFGKSHPSIVAVALGASEPQHVAENIAAVNRKIPASFWDALQAAGLIQHNYLYH